MGLSTYRNENGSLVDLIYFILFDTQLTGYQTSFIAARKVIDTEMRAIESNIFWCFVERLAQINNRAVFVSATNEIINQWFLVFFTNKSSNITIFWASSSFQFLHWNYIIIATNKDIIPDTI